MYDLIARHILGPLADFSRGPKIRRYVNDLEKSQWWPRDKLLELQNDRLRNLVRYAYDKVPYYRRIFDQRGLKPGDVQSSIDLVKLPVLTKKLIRENFDQLIAGGFPPNEMLLLRTGGSTGEPLVFYTTTEDQSNLAYAKVRRALGWWGYSPGDKRVTIQLARPYRSPMGKLRRSLERAKTFVAWQSAQELPLFFEKLEKFQPEFISAYPSFIYLLARFAEKQGWTGLRPKAIITHSEQLYDFQRELFKKVFQCEIYSHYESFEMNEIAAECPSHSGYHIAAESVIVEIVNNEGKPVPPGEEGRVLITNLHNYAMPFIRYDIGDLGAISEKVCGCGRRLPLLTKLNGRVMDFLLTRKGKKIPGTSFMVPQVVESFTTEGVEEFQIIQESYEEVIVKAVLTKGHQREHKDTLIKKITDEYKGILGEDMGITVEFVDQIPTTREGKRRVVISKLPTINEQNPDLS